MIIKILKTIGIWIWCFPQQFIGALVLLFTKAKLQEDGYYLYNITKGSVTLGTFIFLCPAHKDDEFVKKHEKGHTIQSYILGWLYLLVIGLPSILWAGLCSEYRSKNKVRYYDFYTERWANKLMGLNVDG